MKADRLPSGLRIGPLHIFEASVVRKEMKKSIVPAVLSIIFLGWVAMTSSPPMEEVGTHIAMVDSPQQSIYLPVVLKGWPPAETPTPTPIPTVCPTPRTDEWTQHAHDPQRTGYTPEIPQKPWTFKWHWEPDDMDNMPPSAHPVTGGEYIYMPGGSQGLYAIRKSNGQQGWKKRGTFNAAPAYHSGTGYLYAGSSDGKLYKIDSSNGNTVASYNAGSAIDHEVLLVGDMAYVTTANGELHKVNTNTMSQVWEYSANSAATTPASYSASRDLLVYGTKDLYVHAVGNTNGSQKWRVKPTSLLTGDCYPYSFEYGWPVIADAAGVVLIRIRMGTLNDWMSSKFPTTNAEIKARLESNPNERPLFALDLDTGEHKFTPAVGNGGVDCSFHWCGDPIRSNDITATIGPMPVVKTLASGKQVAYVIWRNGDTTDVWDARWDAHMGEMVLDDSTVSGYTAGDVRFVYHREWIADGMITDEMCFMSVAGNSIFHAHWGASFSSSMLDRSDGKGNTRSNPITTASNPVVSRRHAGSSQPDYNTRVLTSGGNLYCDTRWIDPPGFWVYWNQVDPPTPDCGGVPTGYGACHLRRYTFVSDGMIIVVGNGGDLFVLNHSGDCGD